MLVLRLWELLQPCLCASSDLGDTPGNEIAMRQNMFNIYSSDFFFHCAAETRLIQAQALMSRQDASLVETVLSKPAEGIGLQQAHFDLTWAFN